MRWLKNVYFINLIIFFTFILDRLFKALILEREGFFVIKNFLKINFYPNWGIALSIPVSGFIIYALIILILIIIFFFLFESYRKKDYLLIWSLSLIFIGALSNLIDRVRHGFVVDYINLVNRFPVFNLADVMIAFGVGLVLVYNMKKRRIDLTNEQS